MEMHGVEGFTNFDQFYISYSIHVSDIDKYILSLIVAIYEVTWGLRTGL